MTFVTLGGFNEKTETPNPKVAKGHYLGVLTKLGPFLDDDGNLKENLTIVLRQDDGTKIGVNVSTVLKNVLRSAETEYRKEHGTSPEGAYTVITFMGFGEKGKRGKAPKMFELQFDDERVIDVGLDEAKSTAKHGGTEETNADDDTGRFAQQATTNNANRVKELLKNRKAN
jgi:hypothetical protein